MKRDTVGNGELADSGGVSVRVPVTELFQEEQQADLALTQAFAMPNATPPAYGTYSQPEVWRWGGATHVVSFWGYYDTLPPWLHGSAVVDVSENLMIRIGRAGEQEEWNAILTVAVR